MDSASLKKVALITGASSGIGAEAARLFAAAGYIVYGASRRGTVLEMGGDVRPIRMDVCAEADVREGVEKILHEAGQVDVLLHAAGNGLYGPLECITAEDMQRQLDVNFFAAQRLVNAVLPAMRARGKGLLLFVGSVGGIFAVPYQTPYSCSKAALAIYTEGLRLELRPLGVKAAIVEPGDVRTGFTDARKPIEAGCPAAYREPMQRALARMEQDERNGMLPEQVAKALLRVAQAKNPPARTAVGGSYRLFVFLKRLLPARLVEWLLYRMYLG